MKKLKKKKNIRKKASSRSLVQKPKQTEAFKNLYIRKTRVDDIKFLKTLAVEKGITLSEVISLLVKKFKK